MRHHQLIALAKALSAERPTFFEIKGPSVGDKDTASFMAELRRRAEASFEADFAEQQICGANRLRVDYYFPGEATIVEVALSLRNPTSEFERDVLKAVMARDAGHAVNRLVLIAKPGAIKRCSEPGARAIIDWARRTHGVTIEIVELTPLRSNGPP